MVTVSTPNGFSLDNSGRRIVVDPVTRIEGHLRVEVNVDKDNVIRNAVSSGTMWRGLEVILKGRDPRDAWAFTERICGVCTGMHALTSVRSVENALEIQIPENANMIRNMMHCTLYVHDHLVHFYHLHALDWVDVVCALKADPQGDLRARAEDLELAASPRPATSATCRRGCKKFVESGQLGPFRNAYWGHPAYKLPPEANLMAVAHYLEALDFQKEIVKIQTIFGGKNPHPNWLVGGVPGPINLDDVGAVGAINLERLNMVAGSSTRRSSSSTRSTSPISSPSPRSTRTGARSAAASRQNLLAYGDFPDKANDRQEPAHPARGDHQRQPEGGARRRSRRPDAGPGVRDPLLVQVPRREARASTRGTASPRRISRSARTPRAPRPTSRASTRARNTRSSRRHAGRATRWKSARSRAGSSATRRASRSSRNRSTGR